MSAKQDKLLQQAVTAHKAGDSQAAERLYRSILDIDIAHPDANHNLGVLIVSTQDTKDALPYFKAALEANPKQVQYWESAIDALIRADQIEVARNLLKQGQEKGLKGEQFDKLTDRLNIRNTGTSDSSEKLNEVLTLYKQGKFEKIIQQENTLIEEFSQVPSLINILGAANFRISHYSKAIEYFRKVIQLKPDYAEAYNNMGAVYKDNGDLTAAIELFEQAIELNPNYADAYRNLGVSYREETNIAESIKNFLRLVEFS